MKVIASALLLLSSFSAVAEDAKSQLQNLLNKNVMFSADFELVVEDDSGEVIHESEGQFTVQQPNRFYWVDTDSIIVADGKDLWFMDTLAEQVTVYSLKEQQSQSPLSLLTDSQSPKWNSYLVTKKGNWFYLKPSQEQSERIKTFALAFDGKARLSDFWFEDDQSQKSQYKLDNVKMLNQVDAKLFIMDIPKNMMVDDQRN